ncbi:DNA-binding transcriptional regulator, MarR family [Agromyces sp. CF514]|uniref:MarR family winged helix-turn-helix transcriptional regulator n=1 Tax=Agromyces sp. CF514 TaxID=1881031 RepID=UPI0008EEB1EF|nr:MarR family transcriptional regulator [Agromyces sp. CF514]SFR91643.1 DNA-binding transcriptional regulator, MarR family [Agromyces sp. CF514]
MPSDDFDLEATAAALRVTSARLVRRLRAEGGLQEFSPSQATVLHHLAGAETATISELARLEGVRPQSMSATIAELVKLGIIDRRPDPDDGRAQLVFLTDDAQASILRARANKNSWLVRGMTERLTEAERRTIGEAVDLLDRLLDP